MAQGPGHVPANERASRLPGQPVCDKAEQSHKCPVGSRPHSRVGLGPGPADTRVSSCASAGLARRGDHPSWAPIGVTGDNEANAG